MESMKQSFENSFVNSNASAQNSRRYQDLESSFCGLDLGDPYFSSPFPLMDNGDKLSGSNSSRLASKMPAFEPLQRTPKRALSSARRNNVLHQSLMPTQSENLAFASSSTPPLHRSAIGTGPGVAAAFNAHVSHQALSSILRDDIEWSDQERMNNLRERRKKDKYKTSICQLFRQTRACVYGDSCRFAHGEDELRLPPEPKNYKTKLCRNFERDGRCPYAERCQFVHRK